MPKRKEPDLQWESVFENLFAAANTSSNKDIIVQFIKKLQNQFQSASDDKEDHKTAKSITLEDAVEYFSLITHESTIPGLSWKIETIPDVKEMQPSPCLLTFLNDYMDNYDRSSEAACRVALDLILSFCLAEMKGRHPLQSQTSADEVSPNRPTTPKPQLNIKACCEISFTHKINDTSKSQGVVIGGRVDHGLGIVFKPKNKLNRRFHSLLLCVEAKVKNNVESAYGQLVVYLASLRESRINRGKSDSSVYGVATDGLKYVFVTITNEGDLLFSRHFNVITGDLAIVLGCLRYILERAISMTPNLSPNGGLLESAETMTVDDDDAALDLDDSPLLREDEEEE